VGVGAHALDEGVVRIEKLIEALHEYIERLEGA